MTVAPNPSEGAVTVTVAGAGPWSLRVLDTQGRQVVAARREQGAQATMDLTALPAGIYVVELERNGALARHRIVRR